MWNAISIYSFYSNGHVHVYTRQFLNRYRHHVIVQDSFRTLINLHLSNVKSFVAIQDTTAQSIASLISSLLIV